jgi:hypothetical protein
VIGGNVNPIESAAWAVVHGDPLLSELKSGWCLKAVRLIVERAFGWVDGELYTRHGTHRTTGATDRTDWQWWSTDMERSFREQGKAVSAFERQPGDLLFSHVLAKPVGHSAILLSRDLILEVVNPAFRPRSFHRGSICLTPWGEWEPTLVVRLDGDCGHV